MDYIRLIVNTSKTQGYALLYTATPDQIDFISEILHNLEQGVFPKSKKVQALQQRYKRLLQSFPPPKSKRTTVVRKNLKKIYDILLELKTYLLQL